MKKKILSITGVILSAIFTLGSITVQAETDNDAIGRAQGLADGIVEYKLSETGNEAVQDWIDKQLTENAGKSSEWYVFGLSRYGNYDFSAYHNALLEYLSENEIRSAVSRQKYALILALTGDDDSYIFETLDNSIGEQGVMSYVYGLHLLNNGYKSNVTDTESTIAALLKLCKADGGWAIMGDTGETDTTAMALQALTPHYNNRADVKTAVDKALLLLSERQLESGDYSNYGVPNPESTAQVLIALTALGIDPVTDERFIKNGNTLFDGLETYQNSDRSFSHEKGKDTSESATVQTFYALVSYLNFSKGEGSIFDFAGNDIPFSEATENATTSDETSIEANPEPVGHTEEKNDSYKLWACLIIIGVAVILAVILIALKKGRKQNLIVLTVIAAAMILFVNFTDFRSPESYYGEVSEKENPVGMVTISVRCDTIVGKSDKDYIPSDGVIISDSFLIEENETVFDILVEAAKKHSIQLDYAGTADTVYMAGINYIYEFDFGDLSGWLYKVNGETASTGCDRYVLKDGDSIEWLYTCEMGNDLK